MIFIKNNDTKLNKWYNWIVKLKEGEENDIRQYKY